MEEHGADVALLTEAASVLGSLAKGSEDNVKALIEAGAIPVLLNKVTLGKKALSVSDRLICMVHLYGA